MLQKLLVGAMLTGLSLAVGCTGWAGHRTGEIQVKRVVLEGKNFKVAKSGIQSQASCAYLFPTGGITLPILGPVIPAGGIALGDPNLYEQAFKKLREQAACEGRSAQIHNLTEEVTLTSYIVIGDLKVTLTGDVIEFTDEYVNYKNR